MGRKGEITVFLALILISICALLCGIAEFRPHQQERAAIFVWQWIPPWIL